MSDLPPERCTPFVRPFANCGCDIFGPFYVNVGRSRVKRYGCVFTCFSSRAVHIEKLHDLSADSLINALVRFSARRSCPDKIISDNGTNLVGAKNELSLCFKQLDRDLVKRQARRHNVDWVFNPPLASHHGDTWERLIVGQICEMGVHFVRKA